VAVFDNTIFWVDQNRGSLFRVNQNRVDYARPKVFRQGFKSPTGVAVFDNALQPNGNTENINESVLCLLPLSIVY